MYYGPPVVPDINSTSNGPFIISHDRDGRLDCLMIFNFT
jgi:hypothetical protein